MAEQYIKPKYPKSELTGQIIAVALEVHHTLRARFREIVYQRALALVLDRHNLEFVREEWIDVMYKGTKIGRQRVDFIIEDVMVELKAKAKIDDVDYVQTLSYLKASGYKIGLLLNFGTPKLQIKRLAN